MNSSPFGELSTERGTRSERSISYSSSPRYASMKSPTLIGPKLT